MAFQSEGGSGGGTTSTVRDAEFKIFVDEKWKRKKVLFDLDECIKNAMLEDSDYMGFEDVDTIKDHLKSIGKSVSELKSKFNRIDIVYSENTVTRADEYRG